MKTDLFQSCGHCWVFQICWHILCSIFIASSFRIWNSSTGIPSPPLALFVVMLPKTHLTSHSTMSGYRRVIIPSWLSGSWRSFLYQFSSVQSLSHVRLGDPMSCSTPGLPVHHHLPEFTQAHVHQVRDAIQPSHPQSSPSPPAPNPSQHQSLFQWVNSLHEVAKVLEFQL